jgi:hypothetical protein
VLPHDAISLGLFNDDLSRAKHYASSGVDDVREGPNPYPLDLTAAWDFIIIDDAAILPIETDQPGVTLGFHSSLRVAVRLGDRVVGGIDFMSREAATYSWTDVVVGRRIADQVAMALSHERLAEESRRAAALAERTANLEVLDGLLGTVTGVLDIRDVFTQISEIASTVVGNSPLVAPGADAGDAGRADRYDGAAAWRIGNRERGGRAPGAQGIAAPRRTVHRAQLRGVARTAARGRAVRL